MLHGVIDTDHDVLVLLLERNHLRMIMMIMMKMMMNWAMDSIYLHCSGTSWSRLSSFVSSSLQWSTIDSDDLDNFAYHLHLPPICIRVFQGEPLVGDEDGDGFSGATEDDREVHQ